MKIYLASPYSHDNPDVRETRFELAAKAAASLMRQGHFAFSPIAHSHPLAVHGDLRGDWKFWRDFDHSFFDWCDELWVLTLPEWDKSPGVRAEVVDAQKRGIPVKYIDMSEVE